MAGTQTAHPWTWTRHLRTAGVRIDWAPNAQGTRRHAYPHSCIPCASEERHRRTHLPHALCGNAWGTGWPLTDDPTLPTCRSCARLMEAE